MSNLDGTLFVAGYAVLLVIVIWATLSITSRYYDRKYRKRHPR